MKISLNWLSDYVDIQGLDVAWLIEKLTVTTAEIEEVEYIEDDVIMEIDNKSLTNRPDLWCHYGIAREISAITGRKLNAVDYVSAEELKTDRHDKLDIEILDKDKCLRYSVIKIGNVKVRRSPNRIKNRLESCGIRTINLIVDLANYVMLDIGQPMHTFDGSGIDNIKVDSVKQPVKLITLDDIKHEALKDTLMIYNQVKPLAIAGIIGGKESAVAENTKDIVLEAATFEGTAIRKAAAALGIRTEASARYEKFLDTSITVIAIGRFLKLLKCYEPQVTIESSVYDNCIHETKPITITIEHSYIETYLGNVIEKRTIIAILSSLEFKVKEVNGVYEVTVPTFRATKDITCKADIIEEILRIYGYENIKSVPYKTASAVGIKNRVIEMEYIVKDILVNKFNFNEVHSYSWYDNKWLKKLGCSYSSTLKIANSTVKQFDKMRSDMYPNLLKIVYENRKNYDEIKVFEVGRIFLMEEGALKQPRHLTAAFYSSSDEEQCYRYVKGVCSYLMKRLKNVELEYIAEAGSDKENCLCISCGGTKLGYIYSVSKTEMKIFDGKHVVNVMDLNLEAVDSIKKNEIKYEGIPKYPETYLDFSILASQDSLYSVIDKTVKQFKHELVTKIQYIDTYAGENIPENMKSTTIRLIVLNSNRTLQLQEVNEVKEIFIKHLNSNGLKLR